MGVLAGALFGVVAGYDSTLVLGILLAGAGLLFTAVAMTLTIPLTVDLRFGAVTAAEVSKQAAIVAGFLVLVIGGAGFLAFFAVHIAAGLVFLAVALAYVGLGHTPGPTFALDRWTALVKEAAPIAVATVVNVVFIRILVVMTSLLATPTETGIFATSYRVVEVFVGIPVLMVGAAFPVLAHAGASDEPRLAYALQRVGEVALLVALATALVLAFAAEPIVRLLGGDEYGDVAPVLSIQAFALVGAFMTQVFTFGLVAIRRPRALVAVNALALVAAAGLGLALIPAHGATGAAIAATVGEALLALMLVVMLARANPALRPHAGYVVKLSLAAAVGGGAALLASPAPLLGAALALAIYGVVALALRAVPVEVFQALLHRGKPS